MIRSAHTDKHDNRIADERSVLGGDQHRLLISELTTRPILTPGFEIICVEPLDDFCTMLQEPGTALLTRQLEHGIVILLPEHQGTVVDCVEHMGAQRASGCGFARADGEGGALRNGVAKEERSDTKHGVQRHGQFVAMVSMASMSAELR